MTGSSSIFQLPEFTPYEARFGMRLNTFITRRRYYDGTMYNDSAFKLAHKLYAQTKALLSFLARAVDLDVAFVPGMMNPWQLAEGTPKEVLTAQKTLYEWSSWDVEGDDWLEDGATCGEAMIKIVPDEEKRTIKMMRLKPEHALLTKHVDPTTGATVDLALIVDKAATDAEGKQYEYAEAITPTEIRTYWNGAPHGYNGNPDRYPNPLQFTPLVRVKNDSECRPTFAKALPSLDSVNELASYLGNIIGKHAEPQWAAMGVEQSDLMKSGDNIWFFPAGASLDAIVAEIDVKGTIEFIQEIKGETKSNLPELAFDDLRAKDQIATETLEVQLVELDAKIWKMRRRYDAALVDAHMMSALAAITYGYGELAVLLAPHSFDVKRPIRPKSRLEQIREEEAELSLELLRTGARGESMTDLMAATGSGFVPLRTKAAPESEPTEVPVGEAA